MSNDAYEAFVTAAEKSRNRSSIEASQRDYVRSIAYSLAIIADEMVTARERRKELGLEEFAP